MASEEMPASRTRHVRFFTWGSDFKNAAELILEVVPWPIFRAEVPDGELWRKQFIATITTSNGDFEIEIHDPNGYLKATLKHRT